MQMFASGPVQIRSERKGISNSKAVALGSILVLAASAFENLQESPPLIAGLTPQCKIDIVHGIHSLSLCCYICALQSILDLAEDLRIVQLEVRTPFCHMACGRMSCVAGAYCQAAQTRACITCELWMEQSRLDLPSSGLCCMTTAQ